MIVSPGSNTYAPCRHHNHNRLITHTTALNAVQKQRQTKESGDREDSSKITALTMGTDTQPKQPAYDSEYDDESKQYHNVQTGPEDQQHH